MLRIKTAALLIVLIAIAKINWLAALGIIVGFAGLDYLIQKEDEENLQDVRDYIIAMQKAERQRKRDDYFEDFMKEGDRNGSKY